MLKVRVCTACLQDSATKQFLDSVLSSGSLAGRVSVEGINCGEHCKTPARLWMQADGRADYVFDGLNLEKDANDILATAKAYLESKDGWIEDARPCGRLRFRLVARVPA